MIDGAEGTHYELKDNVYTQLPDPENTANSTTSIYIDPLLSISDWADKDPLANSRDADVVTSDMSVEDGIAAYNQQAGSMVEEILASLNQK